MGNPNHQLLGRNQTSEFQNQTQESVVEGKSDVSSGSILSGREKRQLNKNGVERTQQHLQEDASQSSGDVTSLKNHTRSKRALDETPGEINIRSPTSSLSLAEMKELRPNTTLPQLNRWRIEAGESYAEKKNRSKRDYGRIA